MKRTEEMQNLVDNLSQEIFGRTESESHTKNQCVMCGKSVDPIGTDPEKGGFRDAISAKEYRISALCQKCQDEVFGDDSEDDFYEIVIPFNEIKL